MKEIILCWLEPNIRLSASGECFILKIKEGDKWKNFYYTWIGDALKAYVLLSLQKFARMGGTGEVKDLIGKIESLDTNIKEIDADMTDAWRQYADDPIEKAANTDD